METILLYYIPDHKTPELSALAKFSQNLPAINYKLDSFSRTFLFRKKKDILLPTKWSEFPSYQILWQLPQAPMSMSCCGGGLPHPPC